MKAFLEVLKLDVEDIVTTSVVTPCPGQCGTNDNDLPINPCDPPEDDA